MPLLSSQEIQKLLTDAQQVVANSQKQVSNANLGTTLKSDLSSSVNGIQSVLNDIFLNNGLITNDQVNQLDQQMRDAKLKLLQAQNQSNKTMLATYAAVGILIVGALWYISKNK
jgi:subtilase family serine protease